MTAFCGALAGWFPSTICVHAGAWRVMHGGDHRLRLASWLSFSGWAGMAVEGEGERSQAGARGHVLWWTPSLRS